MANVVISGDTSGSVTLAAPAIAGSTTLSLPNSTGTIALVSQIPTSFTGQLIRAPQVLTSGTSYTTPAGCTDIYVELLGGGGGGGGVTNSPSHLGGAGAAGAYASKYFTVTENTAYTYAIGAAGGGGASGTNPGTAGGNTTFTVGATTVTARGGTAGIAGSTVTPKITAGVTSTNGDFNGSSQGAFSIFGSIKLGGTSPFGGGAISIANTTTNEAGANATGYGAGGTGAQTTSGAGAAAAAGGSGSQGFIRIWEYT